MAKSQSRKRVVGAVPLGSGSPFSGGVATGVLYLDASSNIKSKSGFTFDEATNLLTVPLLTVSTGPLLVTGANGGIVGGIFDATDTDKGIRFHTGGGTQSIVFTAGGSDMVQIGGSAVSSSLADIGLRATGYLGWNSNGLYNSTTDVALRREAVGHLSLIGYGGENLTKQHFSVYAQNQNDGQVFCRGTIRSALVTLDNVSGATVTATGIIPARAKVLGVATSVGVALGTGGGTTGYTVGDGTDADRFGAVVGTAVGTHTDENDYTANPELEANWSTSARNVVITATGGNFNGTGKIYVAVWYFKAEAGA